MSKKLFYFIIIVILSVQYNFALFNKKIKTFKIKDSKGNVITFPDRSKVNIMIFASKNSERFIINLYEKLIKYKGKIVFWVIGNKIFSIKKKGVKLYFINKMRDKIEKIFNLNYRCECQMVGIISDRTIKYFDYCNDSNFIMSWVKERYAK